jgi:hypothetical protein
MGTILHPLAAFVVLAVRLCAQAPVDPLVAVAGLAAHPGPTHGVAVEVQRADGGPPGEVVLVAIPWRTDDAAAVAASDARFRGDFVRVAAQKAVQSGNRIALDERGRCWLPTGERLTVVAFAGTQFARANYTPPLDTAVVRPPRLVLRVAEPQRAAVLVVGADGVPIAGVEVASTLGVLRRAMATVATGADGRAEVMLPALGDGEEGDVRVLGVLRDPQVAALPLATAGPLRAQLPPCGRVRVELEHRDAVPGRVRVRFVSDLGMRDGPAERTVPHGADAADFEVVEAGLLASLQLEVDAVGAWIERDLPEVRDGARTVVRVDLDAEPRLRLRVLDPDGRPLAKVSLSAVLRTGSRSFGPGLTTDADGVARLFGRGSLLAGARLEVEVRDGDRVAAGAVGIDSDVHGERDLGDLRLATAPVAVAGVVVDRQGRPVPDLAVEAMTARVVQTRSGADGAFALRLATPLAKVVLSPGNQAWCAVGDVAARTWEFGERHARFVVERAARVRVQLADLPQGVDPQLLLWWHRAGSTDAAYVYGTFTGEVAELFAPPVRGWLALRFASDHDHDLLRIDDLDADGGVEVHNPRLMAVDWRAFARVVHVRARNPGGAPLAEGSVLVTEKNGGSHGTRLRSGTAALLVAKDGAHLQVHADVPGLLDLDLGVVRDDVDVQLQPAPRVAVELSGPLALPDGVRLVVFPDDMSGERLRSACVLLRDGRGAFYAATATEARASLALRTGSGYRFLNRELAAKVVAEGTVLRIDVDAALRAAIARALAPR